MNNAKLTESVLEEEPRVDTKPFLMKRADELTEIIEAIDALSQSEYYKTLEKKVFEGSLQSSINMLLNEKDSQKVAWLQGAIAILSKYADVKKFSEAYRLELQKVKEQLKSS